MDPGSGISLKWDKWRLLSSQLYSSYGSPTVCGTSHNYIVIGTQSAEVLVFDWDQKLVRVLHPSSGSQGQETPNRRYGSVTCVDCDDSRVIAGFSSGCVVAWYLDGFVYLHAPPLPVPPPENTTANHFDGHVRDSKITWVALAERTVFSADSHGLVFEHHNIRLLSRVRSQRLLGRHDASGCVLAALRLSEQYLCILTPQAMFIWGSGIQFMLPRHAELINTSMGLSGALAWHQDSKTLVVCWASSLRVMRINTTGKLEATTERLWKCDETIVGVSFLSVTSLAILTITQTLLIFDIASLSILCTTSISTQNPVHMDLFSTALKDSEDSVVADAYSLQSRGLTVLILGKYEFYCATFLSWADKLMHHLKSSEPVTAVNLAVKYYNQDANLDLLGLEDPKETVSALPDIILASLRYATSFDAPAVDALLDACLNAIVVTGADLVQSIFDLVEDSEFELLYLHKLQVLALNDTIKYLPPSVFRQIFKHLADNKLLVFKDLLLKLDISSLDINLAFDVCRQYKLRDMELFLYGAALQDFTTPLEEPCEECYTFLTYHTSGRVYPTAVPMRPKARDKACRDIYKFLMKVENVSRLVDYNPALFFAALNEMFEQSFLNEDEFSRQTLLSVVRQSSTNHKKDYNLFVASNAQKYPQFLVFSGTEMATIFKELCKDTDTQEATGFLLPVLQMDVDEVICLLSEAEHWTTLEALYISRKRWLDLTKLLIQHGNSPGLWSQLALGLQDSRSVPLVLAASPELAERGARGFAELTVKSDLNVLEYADKMSDAARLEFLSTVYELNTLPPKNTLELLRLSLEADREIRHIIDRMPYSQEAADLLLARPAALMQLYINTSRPNQAMQVLLDNFKSEYMNQGIELCLKAAESDIAEAKKLWVQFLIAAFEHDQNLAKPLSKLLQWSLDNNLDTKILQQTHSLELERLYLDTINKQLTFIDAARRLTGVSASRFAEIAGLSLRGWTFCGDGDCETCGERLSGLGVMADKLYAEWEAAHKRQKVLGDRVVLFKCTHMYHEKCLLKYGGLECAVCSISA